MTVVIALSEEDDTLPSAVNVNSLAVLGRIRKWERDEELLVSFMSFNADLKIMSVSSEGLTWKTRWNALFI